MIPLRTAKRVTPTGAGWLLPVFLSVTAGAVDVIGFLALGGLFTAHITGNLVIVAVHYVTGRYGKFGPLVAVPVFVAVLGAVTLASVAAEKAGYGSRRVLLLLQTALLAGCLGLGAAFGPFTDTDSSMGLSVSMLAVAAMATQNALVRLALPGVPSTAAMTTNITELTVNLAKIAPGQGPVEGLANARRRAGDTLPCVVGFVAGCAAGAALEAHWGLLALALPVVLAALTVPLGEVWSDGRTSHRIGTRRAL